MYEILDNLKFRIGDEVYLRHDPDQLVGFITAITLRETGVTYEVSRGAVASWFYGFELSKEINELMKVS